MKKHFEIYKYRKERAQILFQDGRRPDDDDLIFIGELDPDFEFTLSY